mgnify:CR=1 FL=1
MLLWEIISMKEITLQAAASDMVPNMEHLWLKMGERARWNLYNVMMQGYEIHISQDTVSLCRAVVRWPYNHYKWSRKSDIGQIILISVTTQTTDWAQWDNVLPHRPSVHHLGFRDMRDRGQSRVTRIIIWDWALCQPLVGYLQRKVSSYIRQGNCWRPF